MYLWIDRLCIYQDDSQDWEKESANMGSIYANAYLCLSAASAESSTEGLVPSRKARPSVRLPHTSHNCQGYIEACLLPIWSEMSKTEGLQWGDEPLFRRAWAFQECLFSHRNLLFASDRVYFACDTSVISEDGIELIDVPKAVPRGRHPYRLITDLGKYGPVRPDTARAHWHHLVQQYSRCSLTYPSDKLPAISGIAKEYSRLLGSAYVAGLWQDFLVDELSWQSEPHCTAVNEYRAPSWSWDSVNGVVIRAYNEFEPMASVLDLKVDIDGDNPYGRVRSVWIKLEAPIFHLVLADANYLYTNANGLVRLKTVCAEDEEFLGQFDTIRFNNDDSGQMTKTMRPFSLILHNYYMFVGARLYFCLIVTPADNDPETFRRVGWHTGRQSEIGPPHILTDRSIKTLI